MIFFFYGEDSFRAQQKIKTIRDKFKAKVGGDGYNIEYLDGDLLTIADFFKSIRSGGFLVTKKLIIIRDIFNNKKLKNITVLRGGEVNIKDDGSLDMKNSVLRELDIVLAAIHSGFKNPREKITRRMVAAMENEHVDIIAHPSGRLINQRPAIELELDKILSKAKQTNTILEIK